MFTQFARHAIFAAAALCIGAAPIAHAQEPTSPTVRDYAVFVDLPTAFAFIKLPAGWKFIGKLDAEQLRQLPPGTITSLLPPDDAATRVAGHLKSRSGS
jgi:hypothetical protein